MCLLLETIRIEEGNFCHLDYHQARVDNSRALLFPGSSQLDLGTLEIPEPFRSGIFKCRVVYARHFSKVEFFPYKPRKIDALHLVKADHLSYPFKYLNRSDIEQMRKKFGETEEIILIQGGSVTDTSYTNLAFLSGDLWFTPDRPLLNGTCRQRLIDQGQLIPTRITPATLGHYQSVSLINAMLDPGDLMLPIRSISSFMYLC